MKRSIALIGGLLLAATAQAEAGFHVAAGGGVSKYNESCEGTTSCDTSGTATKLVGGYTLDSGLGFELVALNFGKLKGTALGVDVEIKMQAIGAGAALRGPLGQDFSGVLRLGVANVDVKASGSSGGLSGSTSEKNTQAYFGLGLAYQITKNVFAEVAWDASQGKLEGETIKASAFTVGLGVKF